MQKILIRYQNRRAFAFKQLGSASVLFVYENNVIRLRI